MKHFRISIIVSIVLMAAAAWWGYSQGGLSGLLQALWISAVLGILEVSLSFDNAVVNASVLRHWDAFWQKLFLTVGIVVAVFGMRLIFPLLIVSFATGLGLVDVWTMALKTPDKYSEYLTGVHAEVAAFGGAFLLLVFLNFLFDEGKKLHWLGWMERKVNQHGTESLAVLLSLLAVFACVAMVGDAKKYSVLASGVIGVAIYVAVGWLSELLEEDGGAEDEDAEDGATQSGNGSNNGSGKLVATVARGSFGGFMYLEVLDASFSFDGVIGAFAITSDVVIIMLGLAIGAMFVRSMTVFLVHKGTLEEFVYLEHGAHYAIGVLALIMFASVHYHIPEWFTGLSGVIFIAISIWSSVRHRHQAIQ